MEQEQPQQKDPMVLFKSVKKAAYKSKAGVDGDRVSLYLTKEATQELAVHLSEMMEHDLGVKLDLFITKRQTDGGRTFDAAFMFVKRTQERVDRPAGVAASIPDLAQKVAKLKAKTGK